MLLRLAKDVEHYLMCSVLRTNYNKYCMFFSVGYTCHSHSSRQIDDVVPLGIK